MSVYILAIEGDIHNGNYSINVYDDIKQLKLAIKEELKRYNKKLSKKDWSNIKQLEILPHKDRFEYQHDEITIELGEDAKNDCAKWIRVYKKEINPEKTSEYFFELN